MLLIVFTKTKIITNALNRFYLNVFLVIDGDKWFDFKDFLKCCFS